MKSKELFISLIGCLPTLVLAQATPNMMGTWTAASTSAVIGSAMHHIVPNKKDNDIFFNKLELTMVINRQEGLNFSGILSTKMHKEIIVGALTPDLQGGVMADDDGTYTFKMVDPNTIQACYVQITRPRVAGCWVGKKQQ
jgi:hypothetical protein